MHGLWNELSLHGLRESRRCLDDLRALGLRDERLFDLEGHGLRNTAHDEFVDSSWRLFVLSVLFSLLFLKIIKQAPKLCGARDAQDATRPNQKPLFFFAWQRECRKMGLMKDFTHDSC